MDVRRRRYLQKVSELDDRADFMQGNLGSRGEFLGDRMRKKALYKEFQEAAEILADLAAMMARDHGKLVEDDYSNFETMCRILGVGNMLVSLSRINGLRNILVHEYNGIMDELAYESMGEHIPAIKKFIKVLRKWLKEN